MTAAEDRAAESLAETLRSEDGEDYDDQANAQREQAASGAAPSGNLTDVILLLTRLISTMPANIAAAVKVDKTFHFDNAKLDVRNFVRIKTFTNKHNEFSRVEKPIRLCSGGMRQRICFHSLRLGESRKANRLKG